MHEAPAGAFRRGTIAETDGGKSDTTGADLVEDPANELRNKAPTGFRPEHLADRSAADPGRPCDGEALESEAPQTPIALR